MASLPDKQLSAVLASLATQQSSEPTASVTETPAAPQHRLRTQVNDAVAKKMDQLRGEGRYRVFFDIERQAGAFPKATKHDVKTQAAPDQVCLLEQ